jgi:hypothetical protein
MSDIESLLKEKRVFKPSSEFAKQANWSKKTVNAYRKLGERDPARFWAKMAKEYVSWFTPWKRALDWKPPYANYPWMVYLEPDQKNGLSKKSGADTFQVRSVDQMRLVKKLGQLTEPVMEEIAAGVAICIEYK